MFPGYPNASGKIVGKLRTSDEAKAHVAAGFPSLLAAMETAQINTPRRIAAFLTTLCFESWIEYDAESATDTRIYKGRGFIQLTGAPNYQAAGAALNLDLSGNPEWASWITNSARIAIWYWTKARPKCNEYADNLQMGMINAAIGYPLSGSNDSDRCMVFANVLRYLTQSETVEVVDCSRPPVFVTSAVQGKYTAAPDLFVNNNVHKPLLAGPQTLTVYGPDKWNVVAAHNKNLTDPTVPPGAIKAYPCTQKNFTNRSIDSFTKLAATWSTRNTSALGEWVGAFDNWVGGIGSKCTAEVMVWTHHRYNGHLPPPNATESVPVIIDGHPFAAWRRPLNDAGLGQQYIALAMVGHQPVGSLDLLAVFRWLVTMGWLKGTDTIAAVEYGFELAHDAGATDTFWVDKFTLTDS